MKKIISISMFVLSVGMIFLSEYYTKWPFDYHVAEYISYITLWSLALFVLGLFAVVLEKKRYKKWFYFSMVCVVLSMFLAYITGDGSGGVLSIDGELVTWFLVGLYSFVSIIYFIVQFIKSRKQPQI